MAAAAAGSICARRVVLYAAAVAVFVAPAVGHAIHGETESGAEHEEYEPGPVGKVCGRMLLGGLCFIMAIYWAVNWFQKKPRMFAWKIISATMSIFLAVNTFVMMEKMLDSLIPYDSPRAEIALSMLLLLVLWVALQVSLYKLKENPHTLIAVGTIGAHVCGFANISVYRRLSAEIDDFGTTILLAIGFCVVMLTGFGMGTYLREKRAHQKGDTHELQEWKEACVEVEDDAATLVMGLIIAQLVRWPILPWKPTLDGSAREKTHEEIFNLGIANVVVIAVLVVSTYVAKRMLSRIKFNFLPEARVVHIVQGTIAMSASWITLFWCEWKFYKVWSHDFMVMKTNLAALISFVSFPVIVIFSMNCVASTGIEMKALKSMISALGLLVGLSWEKAFDLALGEVALDPSESDYYLHLFMAVALMDLVAGPAWAFFVLPKASNHVHGMGAQEFWDKLHMNYEGADDRKSLLRDEHTKFGLYVGDHVMWQGEDEDVGAGIVGVVKGFTKARVRVRFVDDIYDFPPGELSKVEMEGSAHSASASDSDE